MSLLPPQVGACLRSFLWTCGASCFGAAPNRAPACLLDAINVPQLASGRFEDEYEYVDARAGSGVGGPVLLARQRGAGSEIFAVKSLRKRGSAAKELQQLVQEVHIHAHMDHPHVARLIRVFEEPCRILLVMEYGKGGSLSELVAQEGKVSEKRTRRLSQELLEAVQYCHTHSLGRICHRDLKHANLVLSDSTTDAELKLIDFGLSVKLSESHPQASGMTGTRSYMAPEVVQKEAYDEACDLWSVGVITYFCLSGSPPFFQEDDEGTAADIVSGNFRPMDGPRWANVSPDAKSFISELLTVDAKMRPDAGQALRHSWLLESEEGSSLDCLVAEGCFSDVEEKGCAWSNASSITRMGDESLPGSHSTLETTSYVSDIKE